MASNIQALQKQLKLGEVPKLIQLAVQVKNAPEFRYLWTEDLCIVQDSTKDISSEQLNIVCIHADSCIVIAASSLHSTYRVPSDTHDRHLTQSPTLKLMHDRAFGCSNESNRAVPDSIWNIGMFGSEIAHDGGHIVKHPALPRNLHLSKIQLYWKIRDLMACEKLPNGDPPKLALFSGMTEEVARKHEPSYLAGLWRESLIADLLWYVDGNTIIST
jgi:hypothetical protein